MIGGPRSNVNPTCDVFVTWLVHHGSERRPCGAEAVAVTSADVLVCRHHREYAT